jgi:hypothetical protein
MAERAYMINAELTVLIKSNSGIGPEDEQVLAAVRHTLRTKLSDTYYANGIKFDKGSTDVTGVRKL